MDDFSTLALEADSRGLLKGVDALDKVVEHGAKAADAADKVAESFDKTGAAANKTTAPVKRATDAIDGTAGAAKKATDDLERMTRATGRARDANGRLSPATKRATDEITGLGGASNRVTGILERMAAAIRGQANRALAQLQTWATSTIGKLGGLAAAFFSVRAGMNAVDNWSDMQSRLGAAIGDMDAAPAQMQRMVDLANASYAPLSQTLDLYTRNVAALRDYGRSADEAADFTESLNHMLVLTATRGQRAESVTNAISNAMAVGRLQGDGLNTILAHGGEVAQALADELGTTRNGLVALASQGEITGDVIANSLLKALDDVRKRAEDMPPTLADAFGRIATNLTALFGRFDQAFAISQTAAEWLVALADRIKDLSETDFAAWAISSESAVIALSQALLVLAATRLPALAVALSSVVGSFTLAGAAGLVFNARIVAGYVAMRIGTASAALYAGALRGVGVAMSLAGGPWGIAAGVIAAVGISMWNARTRALALRDAQNELRGSVEQLGDVMETYYREQTLSAAQAWHAHMELIKSQTEAALALAEAQMEAARARVIAFAGVPTGLLGMEGIGVEALNEAVALVEELQGKLATTEATIDAIDVIMGRFADGTNRAAGAAGALTDAQRTALDQAQEMIRSFERRIELARIEARFGSDSMAAQATVLRHEREIMQARVQSMDVAQSIRDEIMRMWDATQLVTGETRHAAQAMEVFRERTMDAYRATLLIEQAQPGESFMATAIRRMHAFRDAAIEGARAMASMTYGDASWADGLTPDQLLPPAPRAERSGGGRAAKAAEELSELAQAAERWRQRISEAAPATQRFNKALKELDELLREGEIKAHEYASAVDILRDEFANAHPAINSIADAIGQFVASGMRDFRSLLDAFKNMLREMIATAIANPIRIALTTAFMGGGMGGAAQAATGMLGGKGGLLGGGGLLGNLLGSFGTGGSIFGMGGLAGGTGFLGGLGNALSGGFMNIFNIAGNATAGFAGMLGAALPVIGLVALAFTALLGKTKLLDSGIQVTVDGMDVLVETFRTTQKEYLFGLIKSSPKTATEAMDEKDAAPLIKAVRDMQEAIIEAADIFGFGADVFEDFAHVLKISTKDMNEDQAMRAVMEAIEELGDEFAGMVPGLEDFVREGEGAMAALTRMAASLTAVQHMVDTLGHAFDEVGLIGGAVASSLVDAFGGLEAMAEATQVYWRAFYTEQERLETMTRQAADALHELGVEMPRSRDEYRALVESLDLTDESTHELYAALLRMAGVMDAILPTVSALTQELMQLQGLVQTGLDGAIRAAQDAAQANSRAAADWYRASRSIREWIDRTRGSGSAMASPLQARAANEALYQTTMASAMAGDLEAVGRMTGIADQLMASVRETARSRSDAAVAEARILSDMQLLAGVGDIEGARHDVVAGLLGEQVDVLAEARDYIAAGNALTEDMIDTLQSELRALDDAIEAAQLISYQYLKERLEVTVDILADADVPEYLRTLLGNAERGVTGYIDFILRSDLPPDLRWLALSGASEHVKTVEYIAEHGRMPDELMDLALSSAETMVMTVDFMAGRLLPRDLQQLALTDASDLLKSIHFLADALPDDVRRIVFNDIEEMDKILNFRVGQQVSGTVQQLAMSEAREFKRILNVVAGNIAPDRVQDLALSEPAKFKRTLDIIAGQVPSARIRQLALDSSDAFQRVLDFQLGRTPEASVWRLALQTTDQLQKTVNMVAGARLDDDTMRVALAGNSEFSRTVNAVLASDINAQAKRLALGNIGAYDVAVRASLSPDISADVRRVVVAQQGTYAAIINGAISAQMTNQARRILLEQQGQYIANITGVLVSDMDNPTRRLLLEANTEAVRSVTILATFADDLTADERAAMSAAAQTVMRTIRAVIDTAGMSATGTLYLAQIGLGNGAVQRGIVGQIALSALTNDQRLLLTTISETVTRSVAFRATGNATEDQLRLLGAVSATILRAVDFRATGGMNADQRNILGAVSDTVQRLLAMSVTGKLTADQHIILAAGAASISRTLGLTTQGTLTTDQRNVLLATAGSVARSLSLNTSGALTNDQRDVLGASSVSILRTLALNTIGTLTADQRRVLEAEGARIDRELAMIVRGSLNSDQRRILTAEDGSVSRTVVGEVRLLPLTSDTRRLLRQSDDIVTRTVRGAVEVLPLSSDGRRVLRQTSDMVLRTIRGAVELEPLTSDTRRLLRQGDEVISRTINGSVTLPSLTPEQRQALMTATGTITRTVRGLVDLGTLTPQQRTLLTAITGGSDGRLTLGGSFVFDPSTGFRTWYESQTRNSVQGPMDALRNAMTPLRTSLNDLRTAIGEETARARQETERQRQAAAMRELHAYIERNLVTNSAGSHLVTDEQTNAMAAILGITGGGAAKRQAIAAATDMIDNLRRDADGSQQARIRERLANERTPIDELIEQIFGPRRREIPGFATGGTHLGGLRIVGENGPELEATGPSRIYSASQTRAMMGGGAEVVAELRALRAENAALRQEVAEMKVWARKTAESTTSSDKTLKRIDAIGVAERDE